MLPGGKVQGSRLTGVQILLVASLLLFAVLGRPVDATAAADESSAARELAEKHVPVIMIREQEDPLCGIEGEQYQVMKVDALFGNPDVNLMRNNGKLGSTLIKRAPEIRDIRNRGEEAYLDLRGDPLGDTCVYARDFDRMKKQGDAPVAVYAHIAREKGKSGLALQYWFYWYFNQFNDLHESDWEGMQITFKGDTPEQALKEEPEEMILFQHAGGERAKWNDDKVQKEGDQPVVYPAAGSHATFYQSAIYPQNGSNGSGVGCDNTSEPLRELRPQAVLLPGQPTDQGEFAWLSFDGRWGQKEKSFNNGPTGPQTKDQWDEPFTWMPAATLVQPPDAGRRNRRSGSGQRLLRGDRERHRRDEPSAGRSAGRIRHHRCLHPCRLLRFLLLEVATRRLQRGSSRSGPTARSSVPASSSTGGISRPLLPLERSRYRSLEVPRPSVAGWEAGQEATACSRPFRIWFWGSEARWLSPWFPPW